MALRKIVLEGDEILRKKSKYVNDVNDRIRSLIDDMWETLEDCNGIGLAAPQVGVLRRIAVIDTGEEGGRTELINPRIIAEEGLAEEDEGCLSIPGLVGAVSRPERVTVESQDRDGGVFTITGEGMLARALSHEMDHLEGILFTDKAAAVRAREPETPDAEEHGRAKRS
jgi:peptide deformylase